MLGLAGEMRCYGFKELDPAPARRHVPPAQAHAGALCPQSKEQAWQPRRQDSAKEQTGSHRRLKSEGPVLSRGREAQLGP